MKKVVPSAVANCASRFSSATLNGVEVLARQTELRADLLRLGCELSAERCKH
jgi:hypothetical protein